MTRCFVLLLLVPSFLFAQRRFDGTWKMRMDTLRFSATGSPQPIGLTSKRLIDIILAVSGIVLLAPLLTVITAIFALAKASVVHVAGAPPPAGTGA